MSMHLVSPQLSTIRSSRRKKDLSPAQLKKLEQQLIEHNLFLKRMKLPQMTLDQFVDHMRGKSPKAKKAAKIVPKEMPPTQMSKYPSLNLPANEIGHATAKKPEQVYTGDRLIGIAVMHKSNLVPVFSREDAVEISKMRRG